MNQSMLIIGGSVQQRLDKVHAEINKHNIDPIDQLWITDSPSIGIKRLQSLMLQLSKSPQKSSHICAIIHPGELMTTEAQNSLLKVLEEPPVRAILLITAQTQHNMLPTILSRCTLIKITAGQAIDHDTAKKTAMQYLDLNFSACFSLAALSGKDKETALAWTETVLQGLYALMLETPPQKIIRSADIIRIMYVQKMLKETNVQPRFILESMCCMREIRHSQSTA